MTTASRSFIAGLALAVVSILVAVVGVEAVLRVLDYPPPTRSGWLAVDVDRTLDPRDLNQFAYRGRTIEYGANDFVVVLLGDSQVEAQIAPFDAMPERQLEAHLSSPARRVRVFSLGTSGYGQDQELLALRAYFTHFRADLVVVWETPMNDPWNNLFPTYGPPNPFPKPTFWLEEGTLRGPSEVIGEPLAETPSLRVVRLWRRVFPRSRDADWESRYPPPYRPLARTVEPVQDDWQRGWDSDGRMLRARDDVATEKSNLAMFLTPRSARMQYGLDLTRLLLGEMTALARAHSAALIAIAVSNDPSSVPENRHFFEGVHVLNGDLYATSYRQYDENIVELNRGIDFRMLPVTVEPWRATDADAHLNVTANDQVMHDLAAQLVPLLERTSKPGERAGSSEP